MRRASTKRPQMRTLVAASDKARCSAGTSCRCRRASSRVAERRRRAAEELASAGLGDLLLGAAGPIARQQTTPGSALAGTTRGPKKRRASCCKASGTSPTTRHASGTGRPGARRAAERSPRSTHHRRRAHYTTRSGARSQQAARRRRRQPTGRERVKRVDGARCRTTRASPRKTSGQATRGRSSPATNARRPRLMARRAPGRTPALTPHARAVLRRPSPERAIYARQPPPALRRREQTTQDEWRDWDEADARAFAAQRPARPPLQGRTLAHPPRATAARMLAC